MGTKAVSGVALPGREAGGVLKPSGRLWPNGEFSLGYSRGGLKERELTPSEYANEWGSPLDLTLLSNSHKPVDHGRPPRGSKGLTADGRRMVRNAVWRIQRLRPKSCLSFVTLTLPRVTFEEGWYVSSCWSEIVRVFYQKLDRRLESLGLPKLRAGVTEMQPKRSAREGHPSLHLHFVIVGRNRRDQNWFLSPTDIREMWVSVLRIYLPGERDYNRTENVQKVRKDASSYMSKYLSKGVEGDMEVRRDETGWSLPTAWYNLTAALRRWIRENIRRDCLMMTYLEALAIATDTGECCHYYYSGSTEVSPGVTVPYSLGKLKGDFMRELEEFWLAERDFQGREREYRRNRRA